MASIILGLGRQTSSSQACLSTSASASLSLVIHRLNSLALTSSLHPSSSVLRSYYSKSSNDEPIGSDSPKSSSNSPVSPTQTSKSNNHHSDGTGNQALGLRGWSMVYRMPVASSAPHIVEMGLQEEQGAMESTFWGMVKGKNNARGKTAGVEEQLDQAANRIRMARDPEEIRTETQIIAPRNYVVEDMVKEQKGWEMARMMLKAKRENASLGAQHTAEEDRVVTDRKLFALKSTTLTDKELSQGPGYMWVGRIGATWPIPAALISEVEHYPQDGGQGHPTGLPEILKQKYFDDHTKAEYKEPESSTLSDKVIEEESRGNQKEIKNPCNSESRNPVWDPSSSLRFKKEILAKRRYAPHVIEHLRWARQMQRESRKRRASRFVQKLLRKFRPRKEKNRVKFEVPNVKWWRYK